MITLPHISAGSDEIYDCYDTYSNFKYGWYANRNGSGVLRIDTGYYAMPEGANNVKEAALIMAGPDSRGDTGSRDSYFEIADMETWLIE